MPDGTEKVQKKYGGSTGDTEKYQRVPNKNRNKKQQHAHMHPDSWESEQTQHAHNAPWFVFHGTNGKIAKNGLWLPAPSSIHRCVKRQTFLRKMKICLRKASPAGGRPRLGTAQAGGWLGGCVCG